MADIYHFSGPRMICISSRLSTQHQTSFLSYIANLIMFSFIVLMIWHLFWWKYKQYEYPVLQSQKHLDCSWKTVTKHFLIAGLPFNLQGRCLQVTKVTPDPGQFTKLKRGCPEQKINSKNDSAKKRFQLWIEVEQQKEKKWKSGWRCAIGKIW